MAGRTGFTTRASCLLAAGATALLCGLLLGIVDLARAGVLALAVPLLSATVVLRSRVQIANRRSAEPPRATVGDAVVVHLTISNRSRLPTGSLMLEDQLPGQLRGSARFVIDGLSSRETRTVSYRMPALARGRYRAGPLHIRLTDPFHLLDVRRSFTATNEIIVAPVVEHLRNLEPPRSLDTGDDAGSHSIGSRGADDASTREYRTGDDLRKIHWRSSARTGTLMVRQEERPWQGKLSVLLDLRGGAHVEGPTATHSGTDDRLRSSLEWGISAAASAATHGIVLGREVSLIDDLNNPFAVPMLDATQIADRLAVVRASSRRTLEPLRGLLGPVARESTLIAILGDLDPASLRMLAGVHPRGTSSTAYAVLLDTESWARAVPHRDVNGAHNPDRALDSARVLRAAGWQIVIARRDDQVARTLQNALAPRTAGSLAGAR
jgi:uncharacterized protein (DUF58 family)